MTILDKILGDDPKKRPDIANEDINARPMPKYDFQSNKQFNPWITASDDPNYRVPDNQYMDSLLNRAIKSQKDRDNFWFGLNTNPDSKFDPMLFKTVTEQLPDGTSKTYPMRARNEFVITPNGSRMETDPDFERFMRTIAPVGLKDPRTSDGKNDVAFSNNVGSMNGGNNRSYSYNKEPYSYTQPNISSVKIPDSRVFSPAINPHTPVEAKLLEAKAPIWKDIWKSFEWKPFDDMIATRKPKSLFDMIKDFPFTGMGGIT